MVIHIVALPSALRCALCHDALMGGEPCTKCGTLLHSDCRALLTRCPTLGCAPGRRRVVVAIGGEGRRGAAAWVPTIAWGSFFFVVVIWLALYNFANSMTVTNCIVLNAEDEYAVTQVDSDFKAIDDSISLYRLNTGKWPTTLNDLMESPPDCETWRGPYLKEYPVDPWGNPYEYDRRDSGRYFLISYGADGAPGGLEVNEDIVYPSPGERGTATTDCRSGSGS